jgi:uncharacterized protein YndB with AHSA1/START domain
MADERRVAYVAGLDIVAEAIVDADRSAVYAAVNDFTPARVQWWLPRMEVRPRGEIGADLVGGVFELLPRRPRGPGSTLRIVEARENELVRYDYIDGPMVGKGTLTLTPVDGKTRVTYRFQVQARRRFLRFLNPVVAWMYSRVSMPAFFAGLSEHLRRQEPPR